MAHALLPAGAHIIFRHGRDILLIKRSRSVGTWPNFWAFPGGKVDNDELLREAAIRETEEEVGIALSREEIEREVIVMTRTAQGTKVVYFGETTWWNGNPSIMEEDNIADMAWFPISDLPDQIIPHHKEAILAMENGESYREFDVAP